MAGEIKSESSFGFSGDGSVMEGQFISIKRDELLPASYSRGGKTAHFFISTVTTGFGRRGALHQTPFNDVPFFEDLGRKGRAFTIECYIMPMVGVDGKKYANNADGASYRGDRDLLIDIIENETGSGVLVHPTLGRLDVVPTSCSNRFDNSQGRIEYFSLTFAEEGKRKTAPAVDTAGALASAIAQYEVFLLNSFSSRYDVKYENFKSPEGKNKKALPDSLLKRINDKLKKLLKKADDFFKITKTTNAITEFSKDFFAIAKTIESFPQLITGAITDTFVSVQRLITGFGIATANPFDRIKNALSLFDSFFSDSEETVVRYDSFKGNKETNVFRSAQSEDAVLDLILHYSVLEIASAIVSATFTDDKQVVEYKEKINVAIIKLSTKIGDSDFPEMYDKLIYLQLVINIDLTNRIETLPRVVKISNTSVRPALIIAYDVYEDSDRFEEIVYRNGIENPNKVLIGELEVLDE